MMEVLLHEKELRKMKKQKKTQIYIVAIFKDNFTICFRIH